MGPVYSLLPAATYDYIQVCLNKKAGQEKDIHMANNSYKVVIIGSGPGGLTAAIYAARADLAPLVEILGKC